MECKVARQHGQDLLSVKQYYEENNLIFPLKDRLLADKATELIYARAAKTEVPAATAAVDKKADEAPAKPKKPRAKKAEATKE